MPILATLVGLFLYFLILCKVILVVASRALRTLGAATKSLTRVSDRLNLSFGERQAKWQRRKYGKKEDGA